MGPNTVCTKISCRQSWSVRHSHRRRMLKVFLRIYFLFKVNWTKYTNTHIHIRVWVFIYLCTSACKHMCAFLRLAARCSVNMPVLSSSWDNWTLPQQIIVEIATKTSCFKDWGWLRKLCKSLREKRKIRKYEKKGNRLK